MNSEIENILNQITQKSNGRMLGHLAEHYKTDEIKAKQLIKMCVSPNKKEFLKELLGKELLEEIIKVHKRI